ncbi:MAG: glycosyltransferase family 4 protein [Pseudomonas profundi]|uniref:glycosyltransferase family 4 protein n=1 Tax=Pseudomonas profundi TaxID=1981513 RepID=UPI00300382A5
MKIILFANTEWYLFNFRRALAEVLCDAGHEVLLVSPDGPYGEKLRQLGFRWIPAPMARRSLNPFRELAVVRWLQKLIREENVDLIHGFTIKSAVYGSLAARFAGDRARVSAVAGLGYVFTSRDLRARVLRPVVRMMMRFAMDGKKARLILQNPDDAALFRNQRLIDDSRIRLIRGSGVDCSRFVSGVARAEGESLRVLLAARLLWDKGLAEYVAAARTLKSEGRSVQFLLAGDSDPGNPNAVPEETVQGWAKEGLIDWLGHVDDMPALLSSVHAMALPTAYGEGLPRSLIEAAACGLALVTTDAPGCREVVTHEEDGLLIPLRDAKALAAAIARLDDDLELARRLGVAAKEKALREFEERIVIKKTIAVYDELVPAAP